MAISNLIAEQDIQDWLVAYLSELLKLEAAEVSIQKPFTEFGLDSMTALGMLGDLSEFMGCDDLAPSLLYKYTTIEKLSQHLGGEN